MPRLRSALRSGQGPAVPCPHPTRQETCSGSLTFLLSAPAICRERLPDKLVRSDHEHAVQLGVWNIWPHRLDPWKCCLKCGGVRQEPAAPSSFDSRDPRLTPARSLQNCCPAAPAPAPVKPNRPTSAPSGSPRPIPETAPPVATTRSRTSPPAPPNPPSGKAP